MHFHFFRLFNENRELVKVFLLSSVFFKPDLIQQKDMFDNFVRGLTFQPAQKLNLGYTDQVCDEELHLIIKQYTFTYELFPNLQGLVI